MKNAFQQLFVFFQQFGLDVYYEGSIPDDASLPYISVNIPDPDFGVMADIFARIWYRGYTYADITAKVDEIARTLDRPKYINTGDGSIYLSRAQNWCQMLPSGEVDVKCAYLQFNYMRLSTS